MYFCGFYFKKVNEVCKRFFFMKVLICDDDTMTVRALEFQFKRDGFEILKANNGREGQKMLTENSDIDLLVTDMYMPLMNGLELITYVRKTLKRSTPIIVLSMASMEDTIHHAIELGADDYICKPFHFEDMSKKVKQLLKNE